MSTPLDINVPTDPNATVILNFEDGRQEMGTPAELEAAVKGDQIIGLHTNPAVITPGEAPEAPQKAKKVVAPSAPAPKTPAEVGKPAAS